MILEIMEMPITPARKKPIRVQAAAFGLKPPAMSDRFEFGSMLYNAEKSCEQSVSRLPPFTRVHVVEKCTITPKLRLREADKNESLSWILKVFFPGNCRTMTSTHIIEAPTTHAEALLVATPSALKPEVMLTNPT